MGWWSIGGHSGVGWAGRPRASWWLFPAFGLRRSPAAGLAAYGAARSAEAPRTGTRRPSLSAADSIPQDAQLRPPLPPLITAADTGGALSITARSAGAFLPEPVSFLTTCYLLSFILTKSKVITYNISVNNNVLLFVFCLIFHKSVCF